MPDTTPAGLHDSLIHPFHPPYEVAVIPHGETEAPRSCVLLKSRS